MNVGVSDIVLVGTLAWKLYKSCKESSDQFKHISQEIATLHIVLHETEEFLAETQGLSPTRDAKLNTMVESVSDVLKDLEKVLDGYESLGTQAQRTWVNFGCLNCNLNLLTKVRIV